jgi:hypothetical protein
MRRLLRTTAFAIAVFVADGGYAQETIFVELFPPVTAEMLDPGLAESAWGMMQALHGIPGALIDIPRIRTWVARMPEGTDAARLWATIPKPPDAELSSTIHDVGAYLRQMWSFLGDAFEQQWGPEWPTDIEPVARRHDGMEGVSHEFGQRDPQTGAITMVRVVAPFIDFERGAVEPGSFVVWAQIGGLEALRELHLAMYREFDPAWREILGDVDPLRAPPEDDDVAGDEQFTLPAIGQTLDGRIGAPRNDGDGLDTPDGHLGAGSGYPDDEGAVSGGDEFDWGVEEPAAQRDLLPVPTAPTPAGGSVVAAPLAPGTYPAGLYTGPCQTDVSVGAGAVRTVRTLFFRGEAPAFPPLVELTCQNAGGEMQCEPGGLQGLALVVPLAGAARVIEPPSCEAAVPAGSYSVIIEDIQVGQIAHDGTARTFRVERQRVEGVVITDQ